MVWQEAEKTELSIKLGMVALMPKSKHLHQINDFREDSYQFSFPFLNLRRILFSVPICRGIQSHIPVYGCGTGISNAYQGTVPLCALSIWKEWIYVCPTNILSLKNTRTTNLERSAYWTFKHFVGKPRAVFISPLTSFFTWANNISQHKKRREYLEITLI